MTLRNDTFSQNYVEGGIGDSAYDGYTAGTGGMVRVAACMWPQAQSHSAMIPSAAMPPTADTAAYGAYHGSIYAQLLPRQRRHRAAMVRVAAVRGPAPITLNNDTLSGNTVYGGNGGAGGSAGGYPLGGYMAASAAMVGVAA